MGIYTGIESTVAMTATEATITAKSGSIEFQHPAVGLFTRDVNRLVRFYGELGFRETYRHPKEGPPEHVELKLEAFTIAVSSVDAAVTGHGLNPTLGGRPVYLTLWTASVDDAYARLTAAGAPSLKAPRDFLSNLRSAWVADPDGNPINLAQHRA